MKCINCSEPMTGRSDRLFCSAYCRSAYHYEKKKQKEAQSFYKKVDNQLKTNRKILKLHCNSGFTTLRKEVLHSKGFNPHFFTHYWKNQKGDVYLFCYDYGFLSSNRTGVEKYVLVHWQDYMAKGKW